jgi:phospholipase/lecithinase/hemolysin
MEAGMGRAARWQGAFLAVAGLAFAPGGAVAANPGPPKVSQVIALGDSYLDNGALLAATRAALARGIAGAELRPGDPAGTVYPAGRWTNGPTAVEVLARGLGVPLRDFAMGGAKSGDGNYDAWLDAFADTGLAGQVEALELSLEGRPLDPDALVVVSASANDYFQFHDFHQPGAALPDRFLAMSAGDVGRRAARNTARAVRALIAMGARHLIVSRAYQLESIPAVTTVDPQVEDAHAFRLAYDQAIEAALAGAARDGVRLSIFDWAAVTRGAIAQPQASGFRDATRPCQPTVPRIEKSCADPDGFVWWDEWHESAHMHRLVGEALMALAQGRREAP